MDRYMASVCPFAMLREEAERPPAWERLVDGDWSFMAAPTTTYRGYNFFFSPVVSARAWRLTRGHRRRKSNTQHATRAHTHLPDCPADDGTPIRGDLQEPFHTAASAACRLLLLVVCCPGRREAAAPRCSAGCLRAQEEGSRLQGGETAAPRH